MFKWLGRPLTRFLYQDISNFKNNKSPLGNLVRRRPNSINTEIFGQLSNSNDDGSTMSEFHHFR